MVKHEGKCSHPDLIAEGIHRCQSAQLCFFVPQRLVLFIGYTVELNCESSIVKVDTDYHFKVLLAEAVFHWFDCQAFECLPFERDQLAEELDLKPASLFDLFLIIFEHVCDLLFD